jgi:hypothetical protein
MVRDRLGDGLAAGQAAGEQVPGIALVLREHDGHTLARRFWQRSVLAAVEELIEEHKRVETRADRVGRPTSLCPFVARW